jgi:hypothetical protein
LELGGAVSVMCFSIDPVVALFKVVEVACCFCPVAGSWWRVFPCAPDSGRGIAPCAADSAPPGQPLGIEVVLPPAAQVGVEDGERLLAPAGNVARG